MIEFRIKEKTRSLNESFRGDWRPRAAAAKRQRTKAMQACPKWPGGPLLVVRLTRVSPRALDFANLAGALKHVQDGVASRLKVDDASSLVEWRFEQATGEAEVVVQIWKAGEDAPPQPVGRGVERKRMTLRSPPRTGAKAGRTDYAEACCAEDSPCPEHASKKRAPPLAAKAAREAEETFAPAPDAPDMTDALGRGPHPERYDCPCAQCVAEWGAR